MIRYILRGYFFFSGLLAHAVLAGVILSSVFAIMSDHWRVKQVMHRLGNTFSSPSLFEPVRTLEGDLDFSSLPAGKWLTIHEMSASAPASFLRQAHSGSAWDSTRQRLMVFGSDTHGKNWDNTVHIFDLESLSWSVSAVEDSPESYRVNRAGLPVAGVSSDYKPWAMHAFDALAYDPIVDRLIVASAPKHLKPGRFGDWLAGLWGEIRKHPTWLYSPGSNSWEPARGMAQDFFPYSIAYDSDRRVTVGFRPGSIFEFYDDGEGWRKVAVNPMPGYHTAAIFDSIHSFFLLFGNHHRSNSVFRYSPGDAGAVEMPTPGIRPPGDEHVPFVYHSKLKSAFALVDHGDVAEAWVYDPAADVWRHIDSADFPTKLGMNYHLQYSVKHDLLLLITGGKYTLPSVWALRL